MDPVDTREVFENDLEQEVTEMPDGSATIALPEEPETEAPDFYGNLAESLDVFTRNTLATELLELIKHDKESREKRDQQYEEGLKRTGLGDDAPGGATFDGASRAVHPLLVEGCIDFAAKSAKELLPASGPVKIKIDGEANSQNLDRAKKKRDFLNHLLTKKIPEYYPEKEIMLTQLPMGGSQYEKYWRDPKLKRARMAFVPIDKVLLPYAASSFYASPRITEVQDITKAEFEERVASGFYRDVPIVREAVPEQTAPEQANDKIEGLSPNTYNEDGLRRVYEVTCWWELDEGLSPYVIHVDEATRQVLGVYRNWDQNDEGKTRVDWWVEDKFIPWRGVYGIGFPHLLGGLAASLTGALRALLDSAHINNSPGAVKLKGGRVSGANVEIAQTQIQEIDAPTGVDDIRKVMMPLPFNPPSPVLFQLLDWITNQAKGVVATAEEKIQDASNNMPVGTALALIEQGSKVYSSIHMRLHSAQAKGLQIVCRLVRSHPEDYAEEFQKYGLTPEDFADDSDIEPVSDPNIFSEAQRYAQFQSAMQLAQQGMQAGVQINMPVLLRRGYELLRVPGIDEFLPKPPQPVTTDPATENVAAMQGAPLKAHPAQDHIAHVMTHLGFIVNPVNTLLPIPMPQLGSIMAHVAEHLLLFYDVTVKGQAAVVAAQTPGLGPDQIMMRAAQSAQQLMTNLLQDVAPMFQQAGQVVQAKTPPPPQDPAVKASYDVGMAEIERKKAVDVETLKLKQGELTMGAKLDQMQAMLDARAAEAKAASDMQIAMMREENAKQLAGINSQVELMKNDADNKQHQITELLKNRDDNETKILIQQIQQQLSVMTEKPQQQDDGMLKEMQRMLSELKAAKTDDALSAVMQGLGSLIEGQRSHQEHMTGLATQLLRSDS